MTVVETFQNGPITVRFECQYPDEPMSPLSQVTAVFTDSPPDGSTSSPGSSSVVIALSGDTSFAGQTVFNASGSCTLVPSPSSSKGYTYFQSLTYSFQSREFHFQGVAAPIYMLNPKP